MSKTFVNFDADKIFDEILDDIRENSSNIDFPIDCPHCGKEFEAHGGLNKCPHCGEETSINVNVNF